MLPLFLTAMVFAQAAATLQPAGTVSGSLHFPDGSPAGGVRVAALAVDDPAATMLLSITETDTEGRYQLSGLPDGRYYVVAGRLNSFIYYQGDSGNGRMAQEIAVDALNAVTGVTFTVPADSVRPTETFPRSGSPVTVTEAIAFQRIVATRNVNERIALLLVYETNFPGSPWMSDIYRFLRDAFAAVGDLTRAAEYGAKLR